VVDRPEVPRDDGKRDDVHAHKLWLALITAAAFCAVFIPFVKKVARSLNVLDYPDERRVNKTPIPRLGGVAIFASFVAVLAGAWAADVNPRGVLGFALGGGIIFLTGVVDDVWNLRPRSKLLCELLAALVVVYLGGCQVSAVTVPGVGSVALPWHVATAVAVVWLVAVTNAVNLMDGLDGLAAGISTLALASIWMIAGGAHGSVSILCAILIGSCIGFLAYNFHPATIFMGDSGSLFLGFSCGVLSTYAPTKAATGVITFVPVLLLALPIADSLWAAGRRYSKGLVPGDVRSHVAGLARMFVPDRLHVHHRLLRAGLSQRAAVYVLYGVQGAACAIAVFFVLARATPVAPLAVESSQPSTTAALVSAVTSENH
jgi:UDP-GlcNAc:undecaprenyl-phosphate/decaprenyl-phosphate GlcNAc-1-phosphate transferase